MAQVTQRSLAHFLPAAAAVRGQGRGVSVENIPAAYLPFFDRPINLHESRLDPARYKRLRSGGLTGTYGHEHYRTLFKRRRRRL